jgi:hypothetical protein
VKAVMWDVMRSPFQIKDVNKSMFIKDLSVTHPIVNPICKLWNEQRLFKFHIDEEDYHC